MRLLRIRHVLTLACALAALTASPAAAITGGQPDGNAHPYVGLMLVLTPTGAQPACTGFLVDQTTFVTAAHCAPDNSVVLVIFDSAANPGDPVVPGMFHRHPQFQEAAKPGLVGFATHDVAVVELFGPGPAADYPDLPAPGFADSLPNGTPVDLVGYGTSGFGKGGKHSPINTFVRMAATTSLAGANGAIADEFLKLHANKGGSCFGDSGGPNLVGNTVIALNSFLTNDVCAGVSYSYRLDTPDALGFIQQYL